jgi:hypothetical protein
VRKLFLAFLLAISITPALAQAPPPVPALPDAERRTQYTISGTTCACAVGFQIYGDGVDFQSWIEVWLNGVLQTGNYTITSPTGPLASIPRPINDAVLTFNSAQTGTVQIVGARRPRRVSQFPESRGVAARDLNQALTDAVAQNRETWDKINDVTGRALLSQPGNVVGNLPLPGVCSGKLLAFDGTGLNPACISLPLGPGVPRILWANDFGAVCDGTTDDTTAFQNAINTAQAANFFLRFTGNCHVTHLTIGNGLDFGGVGYPYSTLRSVSGNGAQLTVNSTNPVYLHDYQCAYTTSTTNDICLDVTASTENPDSRFWNLVYNGMYIGALFERASNWRFTNSSIHNVTGGYAFDIKNTNNPDGGSSNISGVYMDSFGANAAVLFESSGGLKFTNNTIVGAGPTQGFQIGFQLLLANGANTSDLWIIGNQIEIGRTDGTSIDLRRNGTTGTFQTVIISNNEFNGKTAVNEPVDANGAWLSDVVISNNIASLSNGTSNLAYFFGTSIAGLFISGGNINMVAGTNNIPVNVSTQTSTNCVIGPFTKTGVGLIASTLSSCTSYLPN